jgi:hypothetical protein
MSEIEVIALAILGLAICIANWRSGIFVCLIAGFLLDPIRKIVPGEPVYLTGLVGIFLLVTVASAMARGIRLSFRPIHQWNRAIRLPMRIFFILVIVESGITLFKTRSLVLSTIGLIAYFAPLPAVILGYTFARTEKEVLSFLKLYLVCALLMVSGIYLSLVGYSWKLLTSVGEGLVAFAPTGEQITLLPGFLRAPEVAAWHAATAICVLFTLFLVAKGQKTIKWFAAPIVPFLLMGLIFTGRRKFLVEIALFVCLYLTLLSVFNTSAVKSAAILFAGVALTIAAYSFLLSGDTTSRLLPYYGRAASIQEEGPSRLLGMTVDSFTWVIQQNGVLGAGAGLGSQGAQYFGGGSQVVGQAAEGGFGKVLAELGIPGLVLLCWMGIGLARYCWAIVVSARGRSPLISRLSFALIALVVANGVVFSIAHQAFGDPFILINLGFLTGFMFAVPKMSERAAPVRRREGVLPAQQVLQYSANR